MILELVEPLERKSSSILCTKHRWCTHWRGHAGPCATTTPQRDCTCNSPQIQTSWIGTECALCGRRIGEPVSEETEAVAVNYDPDAQVPMTPPPPFDWNTAHDLLYKGGHERAIVLGLSMVSEQLDYIAQRMTGES